MTDQREHTPRPAAEEIARARKLAGLSVRKAASLAQISEGRWRQIELGYQRVAKGHVAPVNAKDETLARMAVVVGLNAQTLTNVGETTIATLVEDWRSTPGSQDPDDHARITALETRLAAVEARLAALEAPQQQQFQSGQWQAQG